MNSPWNTAFDQFASRMLANAQSDLYARAQAAARVTQMFLAIETASLEIADNPIFRENRAQLEFDARQRLADVKTSQADRAGAISILCALTMTRDDDWGPDALQGDCSTLNRPELDPLV